MTTDLVSSSAEQKPDKLRSGLFPEYGNLLIAQFR
jgi:hypothetical protein